MYSPEEKRFSSITAARRDRSSSESLLSRGKENHIREISFEEAFPLLLRQTYRPEEAEALEKTLGLLQRLDGMVRFYDLVCRPDPEAAQTAYKALFRREGNDGEQNDIL